MKYNREEIIEQINCFNAVPISYLRLMDINEDFIESWGFSIENQYPPEIAMEIFEIYDVIDIIDIIEQFCRQYWVRYNKIEIDKTSGCLKVKLTDIYKISGNIVTCGKELSDIEKNQLKWISYEQLKSYEASKDIEDLF